MKYLLILCALFFACPGNLYAQADSDSTTQAADSIDKRIIFQSKVRQMNSYLMEGNKTQASRLYDDVLESMQEFIKETYDKVNDPEARVSSSEKRKLKQQQQLFNQFLKYRPDIIRNREGIQTWSNEFIKTLYP